MHGKAVHCLRFIYCKTLIYSLDQSPLNRYFERTANPGPVRGNGSPVIPVEYLLRQCVVIPALDFFLFKLVRAPLSLLYSLHKYLPIFL